MSTVILFLEQLRGYTGKPKGRQAPPTEIPKTVILEQKELQTSQPKSLILLRRGKERHGKGTELTQGPTASQHPSSPLALALRACKPGGQQEGSLLEEQQQQKTEQMEANWERRILGHSGRGHASPGLATPKRQQIAGLDHHLQPSKR